jgi:hypothetical protein
MTNGDKISLGYILTAAAIGLGSIAYAYRIIRKAEASGKLENKATFHALKEVCRLLNEGKIRTQEDVDFEFEFAYMTYKLRH